MIVRKEMMMNTTDMKITTSTKTTTTTPPTKTTKTTTVKFQIKIQELIATLRKNCARFISLKVMKL